MTQAHEMDESCANLIETTILEEFSCRGHKTKPAARKLPWIHEIGESRTEQHLILERVLCRGHETKPGPR